MLSPRTTGFEVHSITSSHLPHSITSSPPPTPLHHLTSHSITSFPPPTPSHHPHLPLHYIIPTSPTPIHHPPPSLHYIIPTSHSITSSHLPLHYIIPTFHSITSSPPLTPLHHLTSLTPPHQLVLTHIKRHFKAVYDVTIMYDGPEVYKRETLARLPAPDMFSETSALSPPYTQPMAGLMTSALSPYTQPMAGLMTSALSPLHTTHGWAHDINVW